MAVTYNVQYRRHNEGSISIQVREVYNQCFHDEIHVFSSALEFLCPFFETCISLHLLQTLFLEPLHIVGGRHV